MITKSKYHVNQKLHSYSSTYVDLILEYKCYPNYIIGDLKFLPTQTLDNESKSYIPELSEIYYINLSTS